ncbi:MAG: DivIVA domain-containing protein [Glycomyces artemisiae]|uniref:Cell wall synthesis protein Wag31 n=1 Tax=Glycomyces artemisiae TaxID=1076443 RepID=A0A850CFX2_9ACTN|nr:DivIVA domain-containing protein [Glycomyces artemisiae]
MPLTPADVHNVTFKKPMLGKRGYDEDEVDGFLDEVERELARLSDENGELRAQFDSLRAGAPPGAADHAEMAAALDRVQREKHAMEQQLQELDGELHEMHQQMVAAQQQAQQLQQELAQRGPQQEASAPAGAGGEQEALRLLMVAQRTADEHLEDSRREADTLLSEAQRESQTMVAEAQREAQTMVDQAKRESTTMVAQAQRESKTMVTEAQRDADTMVTEARTQAEDLVGQARDRAERMEMEAEEERQKVIGQLEESRTSLLHNIDELKTFEREYRTRLKLYLESQLRDLNGQQGRTQEEAFEEAQRETGGNERTGARSAFVMQGGRG